MVEDFRGFLRSQILNCHFTRCRPTNQWYDQNFAELFLSDAVDGLSPRLDCVRLSQAVESRSKGSHHATLMSLQYENRLQALLEEESYDLSWVSGWLNHIRRESYQHFRVISVHAPDEL